MGKVVGKSHDGGIDGIINEDKLGLDKIYIQAKRYASNNHVGSKNIQAFSGAMKKVTKGVNEQPQVLPRKLNARFKNK